MGNLCFSVPTPTPEPKSSSPPNNNHHQIKRSIVNNKRFLPPSTVRRMRKERQEQQWYENRNNYENNEDNGRQSQQAREFQYYFQYANEILEDYPNYYDLFEGIVQEDGGEYFENWYDLIGDFIYKGSWKDGLPHGYGMVYSWSQQAIICMNFRQGYIETQKYRVLGKIKKYKLFNFNLEKKLILFRTFQWIWKNSGKNSRIIKIMMSKISIEINAEEYPLISI